MQNIAGYMYVYMLIYIANVTIAQPTQKNLSLYIKYCEILREIR